MSKYFNTSFQDLTKNNLDEGLHGKLETLNVPLSRDGKVKRILDEKRKESTRELYYASGTILKLTNVSQPGLE